MGTCVNQIAVENIEKCPLCGGETVLLYANMKDKLFGVEGTYTYRKCRNEVCTLWYLNPMPVDDDIGKCYHNYYTHEQNQQQPQNPFCLLTRAMCKWSTSLIEWYFGLKTEKQNFRYMGLKEKNPGNLLEIGCGNGKKMLLFKKLGWNVEGVEPDKNAAAIAKEKTGAVIYTDSINKLNLEGDKYDAIIMHHVAEHFKYPNPIFAECFRVLKKNGLLVLATPNCDSYASKKYDKDWFALEPPRHLMLYNKKSLTYLAINAGFRDITIIPKISGQRWSFEAAEEILSRGDCKHLYSGGLASPKSMIKSVFRQLKHCRLTKSNPEMGNEIFMWCKK